MTRRAIALERGYVCAFDDDLPRSLLELHVPEDEPRAVLDDGTWLGCAVLILAFVVGVVIGGLLAWSLA